MLELLLARLPLNYPGIYGGKMPERALWLYPDLARALLDLLSAGIAVVLSDGLRSPARSLQRQEEFRQKGGPQLAQPPGYSAHNFGLAVDIKVDDLVKVFGSKPALDEALRKYGLWCFRRDGRLKPECWHYNYLGTDPRNGPLPYENTTARAIERRILELYGAELALATPTPQQALAAALKAANCVTVKEFQAKWGLKVDGIPGPRTRRTLASVTATRKTVEI